MPIQSASNETITGGKNATTHNVGFFFHKEVKDWKTAHTAVTRGGGMISVQEKHERKIQKIKRDVERI